MFEDMVEPDFLYGVVGLGPGKLLEVDQLVRMAFGLGIDIDVAVQLVVAAAEIEF
jgi:hypothetical protein